MSNHNESDSERDSRQSRMDKEYLAEREQQNKTNKEAWNNSGLLRDIQARQCEVLEKMGEMKISIEVIEKRTVGMNKELGTCKDDIKDLKSKPLVKMSWKQVAAIIGSTATVITIVYTLVKIFLGIAV